MADEWVLSLHYRDGRIEKATAGSAMTAEHLQRIQAEIARVLGSLASTKVSRWTMFSSRPVEASWRYREQFQGRTIIDRRFSSIRTFVPDPDVKNGYYERGTEDGEWHPPLPE